MINIAFEQYLFDLGYKPYSKQLLKGEWVYCEPINISTAVTGGLDQRWILDGVEIVVGLNEVGKPITIIEPRPILKDMYHYQIRDDDMNRALLKFSHEEIYNAMFDRKIILDISA